MLAPGWCGCGLPFLSDRQWPSVLHTAECGRSLAQLSRGAVGHRSSKTARSARWGGPNAYGVAPIVSETSHPAYMGEDFCGFGTHRQCLAAIWKNGIMAALRPIKGGRNSQAYWTNNEGQTAGFAENGIHDSTCSVPFQVLRFEAAVWQSNGRVSELHPLNGDTVGFAFGINEKGQAVGTSGLCSNTSIPPNNSVYGPHAVLWEADGSPVNLGSLGGPLPNVATAINDSGEVVGASQFTDGTIHPFLWTKATGMQDLGILPGAVVTLPPCCHTINNKGEVVGYSIDGTNGNMRAVLWQNNRTYRSQHVHSAWFTLVLAGRVVDQ